MESNKTEREGAREESEYHVIVRFPLPEGQRNQANKCTEMHVT